MQPLVGPRHPPLPLLCNADTSQYMWANLPIAIALVAVGTWIFLHVDIQAKNMPGKGELPSCCAALQQPCAAGQHRPTRRGEYCSSCA